MKNKPTKPKSTQKSERIQFRCTKAEKKYWNELLSGNLSAHMRGLMPPVPSR